MDKIIGITMGDPAGIGAEVTVKALGHPGLTENCRLVVIGDRPPLEDALRFTGSSFKINTIQTPNDASSKPEVINLIDMNLIGPGGWEYGTAQAACGEAAYRYIEKAVGLASRGEIAAMVTAPINKEAVNMAGHHYSGHTEILGTLTGTKKFAMLLACGALRVIHVTTHVSMLEACSRITTERVCEVIRLAAEGMELLGFSRPRIAVAGFNPHCSENGLFGDQEEKAIIPAIELTKKEGLSVEGPVPGDTVFVKALAGQYDIVVAMYHDQGHIPLKLAGFRLDSGTNKYTAMGGINCTIGLPIIRTSVDHGTAYDRAGKNLSNEQSLVEALEAALSMAKNKEAKTGGRG